MQQQETHLQQMLVTLRTRLLVMCASTSIALEDAGTALIHKDVGRANAVIDGDEAIDALENDIDDKALSLLARAQPVARDLRFVVSALRMVVDLERIGDEAANIAERAVLMQNLPGYPLMEDVIACMDMARKVFDEAVAAYRDGDMEAALRISRNEDEAIQTEVRIIQKTMEHLTMPEPRIDPYAAMNVILITRSLTRIRRRSAHIAEHAYFTCEGLSLKHRKPQG